jgi:hypothetical protein
VLRIAAASHSVVHARGEALLACNVTLRGGNAAPLDVASARASIASVMSVPLAHVLHEQRIPMTDEEETT